ncbi:MAG: carbohydrate binding family 9 domain-containing protein [Deltaproteobacteria bacterium]|nr:carbohydrate binding family 9 domain-containing protein [Deltaproteobacteria bacterium]
MSGRVVVFALALGLLADAAARGETRRDDGAADEGADGLPHARATWLDAPPTIDGHLDDAAWASLPRFGGFGERRPNLRATPPVTTWFQVGVDADALYVAVRCLEVDRFAVVGRTTARDAMAMFDDDAISVKLDPRNDRRTTYGFALNPVGARMDYLGVDESDFRTEVDTIWEGVAAIDDAGWAAEFRIPWASLNVDPARLAASIGLELSRDHARASATYDWAVIEPPFSAIAASRYGRLDGLDVVVEHMGADGGGGSVLRDWHVTPFVVGGFVAEPSPDPTADAGLDAGLDFGDVHATLTVNTDFAQVDLDDRVVNLTQYDIRLPEKRDFFLTDPQTFRFGYSSSYEIIHTRRIGLFAGEVVPILTGLSVAGRAGGALDFGVLQVVTRPEAGLPWTSDTVARGVFDLGGGSKLGAAVTDRRSLEEAGDYNTVVGVDGGFRGPKSAPLRGFGRASVSFTGRAATLQDRGTGGPGTPEGAVDGGFLLELQDELFRPWLFWSITDASYRADLGFVQRVGIQLGEAGLELEPRFDGALERLTLDVWVHGVADQDLDGVLDWFASGYAALAWKSGYSVSIEGGSTSETVPEPFDIGDTTIAAGVYDGWRLEAYASTPSTATATATLNAAAQTFFGGHLVGGGLTFTWRPGTFLRLEVAGNVQQAMFEDGGGDFLSVLVNGRASIGLREHLSLDLYGGWSKLADAFAAQSRLRWTFLPGSDFFLVYQLALDTDTGEVPSHSLLAKLAWRFP